MPITVPAFVAALTLCVLPAESVRSSASARTARTPPAMYLFIEIEADVHLPAGASSEHPSERRWYISNVVAQPEDVPTYSLVKQRVMPYFSRNVMDPFEARGFSLDYGEQDVKLCGDNPKANYESRPEAEETRRKAIERRKLQSGNIYSFDLVLDGPAKGEETSKPKLIYRDKAQPTYGGAGSPS